MDAVTTLIEYLKFPSVSTDSNYSVGMQGARNYISGQLEVLGFSVENIKTNLHPILLAQRHGNPEWPHVVLYGHYDVQPADPFERWSSAPFDPEVRDGRIYARGAADNKGPTIVHMTALQRVLKKHPNLPLNITYVIEGEEEIGSPSMPKFFDDYAERLSQADYMLVSDTGSPSNKQIVITTALRGLIDVEIKVTGAKVDLHSGIHGGAVYNPLQAISEICASLHNTDGTVNIPGFYDGIAPLEDWERSQLDRYPESLESYKELLGVSSFAPCGNLTPLEAVRFGPTLEFNGMGGGYQGEGSKTVIPSEAFAKITCRLVDGQDPTTIQEMVIATIKERCPKQVELTVRRGAVAPAYLVIPPDRSNTPKKQPLALANAFRCVATAITNNFEKEPIYLREGGSIPVIADFKQRAGLDAIMVGLFTPIDNLHAPDESFDLELMNKAIATFEEVFISISNL